MQMHNGYCVVGVTQPNSTQKTAEETSAFSQKNSRPSGCNSHVCTALKIPRHKAVESFAKAFCNYAQSTVLSYLYLYRAQMQGAKCILRAALAANASNWMRQTNKSTVSCLCSRSLCKQVLARNSYSTAAGCWAAGSMLSCSKVMLAAQRGIQYHHLHSDTANNPVSSFLGCAQAQAILDAHVQCTVHHIHR